MPNNNNKAIASRIVWNFRQLDNQTTEVFVYDAIADKQSTNWWTGEKGTEITPTLFNKELSEVTTQNICVRINSRGGDVFAAEAIRTAIREKRQEGKNVTCKIDGFCGSAAVGIAAACEKTFIPSSAWFMIHDPVVFSYGYYGIVDFRKGVTMLEKIKQGIINAYSAKTGKDKQEISDLMTAETWYTGDEAVENGFCDELMFEEEKTDSSTNNPEDMAFLDVAMYQNLPIALLNSRKPNGGGFSNKQQTQNKKGVEPSMDFKTVDELKAAYPALTAQIAETATAAERKRIQDIEGIALAGFEGIVAKAKFEAPTTAAEVAMNILAEQKKQGATYLANMNEDVNNSGANDVPPSGFESAGGKANPFDAAIDKVLPK